jgi:hypothetical protein
MVDLYLLEKLEAVYKARIKMDFSLVMFYHLSAEIDEILTKLKEAGK